MTHGWSKLTCLHSRRLEVVGERENGARARGVACLLLARPFFLVPTTSKRLLRRLIDMLKSCQSETPLLRFTLACEQALQGALAGGEGKRSPATKSVPESLLTG